MRRVEEPRPVVDAIVLAGGRGERLGGVSKADLEVAGRRMLDRVLEGVEPARQVVVVGDVAVPEGVLTTWEDPPGGGPAAGLLAGLEALTGRPGSVADWVLVLACDLPGAAEAVPAVLEAVREAGPEHDAAMPLDATGHPQWLLGAYRVGSLQAAGRRLGDAHDRSVHALVGDLERLTVHTATQSVEDVDTWEDHARWSDLLHRPRREEGLMGSPEQRPQRWNDFIAEACAPFDIDPAVVDVEAVHALSKVVAHEFERPMAPVSAFVLGWALAQDPDLTVAEAQRRIESAVPGRGERA